MHLRRLTSSSILAALVGVLVLVPYLTTTFAFRRALHVQAAVILALVLSIGWLSLRSPGSLRRLASAPPLSMLCAVAYATACLAGAIVGLLRGNDAGYLLGQVVSLGLLPLGWLAAAPSASQGWLRAIAAGTAGAVASASLIHLGVWVKAAAAGEWSGRFFLGNGISASGAAVLAALLVLPLRKPGKFRERALAVVVLWLAVLLILGSGVRGLWVAFAFGCLIALLIDRQLRRSIFVRLVVPGLTLLAVGWVGAELLQRAAESRGEKVISEARLAESLVSWGNSLELHGPVEGGGLLFRFVRVRERRIWPLTNTLPIEPHHTLRLEASILGEGTGDAAVGIQWIDGHGEILATSWSPFVAAGSRERRSLRIVPPSNSEKLRFAVLFSADADGVWEVRDIGLDLLGPRWIDPALRQIDYLQQRFASFSAPGSPVDASLAFRVEESRSLLRSYATGTLAEKLLGRGLGSTFIVEPPVGQATEGRGRLNYIHNFYVFLLYKLGLVGTSLVLFSLIGWTYHLVRAGGRFPPGTQRELTLALAAAWIAYCAWSVSSPAILDFRLAPLWGLLLGSIPRTARPAQDEPHTVRQSSFKSSPSR